MIQSNTIILGIDFENIMNLWIQYSGIIALGILIIFTILYFKNKKKENMGNKIKKYKIIMIILVVIIIIDIILWGIELYTINHLFENVKDIDVSDLII